MKVKASLPVRRHPLHPVNPRYGDLVLLAYTYVTGLLDCATFNNWGVFVGGQTGNSVILCLSSAGLPASQPYSWATTLVSISSFLVGALVTFWACTAAGKLRRLTITTNFPCQGLMIVLAAALVTPAGHVPLDNTSLDPVLSNARILIAVPPLAFQGGAQIATSRLLGFYEIPVNVLTSTYADLACDPKLLAWDNVKRNRRVAAILGVMAGALSAAWMMKMGPGIKACLWLGAGIKIVVALVAGLFMQSAEEEAGEDRRESSSDEESGGEEENKEEEKK